MGILNGFQLTVDVGFTLKSNQTGDSLKRSPSANTDRSAAQKNGPYLFDHLVGGRQQHTRKILTSSRRQIGTR